MRSIETKINSDEAVLPFVELEALFASSSLSAIDRRALEKWKPKNNFWNRLKPVIARHAGASLRWSEVDGHRIQYWDTETTDKPWLVLIHGFGASKENWPDLCLLLRGDYRVLVPDLPGFGNSTFRTDCDYRVDTQADRVYAWLEAIGVESAFVAGSSMGGAIASVLAARYPEKVRGLCLMNSAGAPGLRRSMLEAGLSDGRNLLVANTPREARRVFNVCFHSRKRLLGIIYSLLMGRDMAHRSPVNHAIFFDLMASLAAANQSLAAIAAPTFVLWGDSDQVLDKSCIDAFLDAIPQARAMIFTETGHLPMVERPADTAMVLRGFFNAVRVQGLAAADSPMA